MTTEQKSFKYAKVIDAKIWISKNASLCLVFTNRLNRYFTHKAVYLPPANIHTNHLLAYLDCHYCKQVL